MNLFELSAQYRAMADTLADLNIDEQTLVDTLEAEGGALTDKAQNVAYVIRNLEATADAINEVAAAMGVRRKAIENRAAGLRRYLLAGMQMAGITKIECPHFVIAVKRNPEACEIFDEAQIPAEFIVAPPPPPAQPNKDAIRLALQAGEDVPGARMTRSVRLDIR